MIPIAGRELSPNGSIIVHSPNQHIRVQGHRGASCRLLGKMVISMETKIQASPAFLKLTASIKTLAIIINFLLQMLWASMHMLTDYYRMVGAG